MYSYTLLTSQIGQLIDGQLVRETLSVHAVDHANIAAEHREAIVMLLGGVIRLACKTKAR